MLWEDTFGQTNTSTITLFLRRKNLEPNLAKHLKNRIEAWFSGNMDDDDFYKDSSLLEAYFERMNFLREDYIALMRGELTESFMETEMVQDYIKTLNVPKIGGNSSATALAIDARKVREEAQKFVGSQDYSNLTQEGRKTAITNYQLRFIRAIEKEKLYFFLLAASNPQSVLVVDAPENKDDEKKFLGYEWSNRKGAEGIHYLNTGKMEKAKQDDEDAEDDTINQILSVDDINTPLFNPKDLFDCQKINTFIRCNYTNNENFTIPDVFAGNIHQYNLTDMLEFNVVEFDKVFNTKVAYKVNFDSKYERIALNKIVLINPSKKEVTEMTPDTLVSFVDMPSVSEQGYIAEKVDRPYREVKTGGYTYFAENDIIIAKITPCMENGKCAIATGLTNGIGFGSTEFHVFRCSESILNVYLYHLLNTDVVRFYAQKNMTGSSGHRRVPELFYSSMEIPLPPKEIQSKIGEECEAIDSKRFECLHQIEEAESSIITHLSNIHGEEVRLSSIFSLSSGKLLSKKNRIEGNIPVYGGNGVTGFHNQSFVDADTIVIGRVGEYCGSVHLTDKPAWITDNALYVREYKMDAVPKYILYALRRLNLNQYANRTGQPNISQSSIANVLMVMPSIADQVRIVKEIEKFEIQINEARSFIESSSAKKQEILDKYLK